MENRTVQELVLFYESFAVNSGMTKMRRVVAPTKDKSHKFDRLKEQSLDVLVEDVKDDRWNNDLIDLYKNYARKKAVEVELQNLLLNHTKCDDIKDRTGFPKERNQELRKQSSKSELVGRKDQNSLLVSNKRSNGDTKPQELEETDSTSQSERGFMKRISKQENSIVMQSFTQNLKSYVDSSLLIHVKSSFTLLGSFCCLLFTLSRKNWINKKITKLNNKQN